MRISPVACLYFLLLGSSAFAQLSRRDLEDIERHRGESREMSVVVETWDFLDVDEEEATPEEIDVGAGAVLEYFWESPDSLLRWSLTTSPGIRRDCRLCSRGMSFMKMNYEQSLRGKGYRKI